MAPARRFLANWSEKVAPQSSATDPTKSWADKIVYLSGKWQTFFSAPGRSRKRCGGLLCSGPKKGPQCYQQPLTPGQFSFPKFRILERSGFSELCSFCPSTDVAYLSRHRVVNHQKFFFGKLEFGASAAVSCGLVRKGGPTILNDRVHQIFGR